MIKLAIFSHQGSERFEEIKEKRQEIVCRYKFIDWSAGGLIKRLYFTEATMNFSPAPCLLTASRLLDTPSRACRHRFFTT